MKQLLLEMQASGEAPKRAWLINDTGFAEALDIAAVATLSLQASNVTLVLDGTSTTCLALDVPDLPKAKLVKILPSLLADQCATAKEDVHIALMGDVVDGRVVVVITAKAVMDKAISYARSAGFDVSRIIPDYLLVPVAEQVSLSFKNDGLACLRFPDGSGCAVEPELIDAVAGEKAADIPHLDWKYCLETLTVQGVTLMQGAYAQGFDIVGLYLLMRRSLYLLIALFVMWIAVTFYQVGSLHEKSEKLTHEAETVFRQTFPDVSRIVNLEAQTRQAMTAYDTVGEGRFLLLSAAFFDVISKQEGVHVESIRFDDKRGEYAATLSFRSYRESETLWHNMREAGLVFKEGSSRQEGVLVYTDIILEDVKRGVR